MNVKATYLYFAENESADAAGRFSRLSSIKRF